MADPNDKQTSGKYKRWQAYMDAHPDKKIKHRERNRAYMQRRRAEDPEIQKRDNAARLALYYKRKAEKQAEAAANQMNILDALASDENNLSGDIVESCRNFGFVLVVT